MFLLSSGHAGSSSRPFLPRPPSAAVGSPRHAHRLAASGACFLVFALFFPFTGWRNLFVLRRLEKVCIVGYLFFFHR